MSTLRQLSFSGGELAPSLYQRTDLVKYATGLRTLRNFFVPKHGGAFNRPGTKFIGEVKDSSLGVRLHEFVFNDSQTYVLEFGNLYMRVIRNGAQVTETAVVVTNITQATRALVTAAAHGYSDGDEVFITGVVGMIEVNGRNFKVANKTTNNFEIQELDATPINSLAYTAYVSGGTSAKIFELVTTYLTADLSTLQFVQSADIITIVHPTYPPRELARSGHTTWTITDITFAPGVTAPASLSVSSAGTGSTSVYHVTAVDLETFEESLASTYTHTNKGLPSANDHTITWTGVAGFEYNVYLEVNGIAGFIGIADSGGSFLNNGITPDTTDTPPTARNPFSSSGNYPSTVSYIQQRLTFANTNNDTEKTWMSRTGNFKNFTHSNPLQADDAVTFTLAGREVNAIKHLVDIGKLVSFTTGGEWVVNGDEAEIIRPTSINPKQQSYNGSADVHPVIINDTAIYVQSRDSVIRDLKFNLDSGGYKGDDLTIFSSHLFEKFTIVEMAYQQIPNSIIWVVRSDGTLLSLTYIREHQLLAWARHDFGTGATVENVSSIPESDEDFLYVVVRRTINNKVVRFIERMDTRQVDDIRDYIGMDSALTFDGRNTDTSETMTLSGGTAWDHEETLTLTSSSAQFLAGDVGNAIHIRDSTGNKIRFTIEVFTSTTVVTGKSHKIVPTTLRAIAVSTWDKAVDTVTGLWHIEGENVSVLADGFVSASPNNASHTIKTVANGAITLGKPYAVIHVGLPIIADLETLDVDTNDSETLIDKKERINNVSMHVEASRGIWMGPQPPTNDSVDPLENLSELKVRNQEDYDSPVSLKTQPVRETIKADWNENGRVFIRQVDPVPLGILSISPEGQIPFRKSGS